MTPIPCWQYCQKIEDWLVRTATLLIVNLAFSLFVPAAASAGSQKNLQVTQLLEEAGSAWIRSDILDFGG
jgi:hypothetical protein